MDLIEIQDRLMENSALWNKIMDEFSCCIGSKLFPWILSVQENDCLRRLDYLNGVKNELLQLREKRLGAR